MTRGSWFLILLALPLAAHAATYKWKDKNGRLHFTQVPPLQGIPYEVIGPAAPPPTAAPNQESLNQSLEQARQAAPEQQRLAEQADAIAAARRQNCMNALERIAYLDARTPRRLATKDEQGNVARMTDEEFQRQRAAEEQRVKENCD
jgi:hypothetical protein